MPRNVLSTLEVVATFGALFLSLFNAAPLYTAMVNGVPARLRASAVACNLLVRPELGDALSSTVIGHISDATGSLALAVATCALPLLLGGAVLLWGAFGSRAPAPVAAVEPG